jgi:hypothetical protein
LRGFEVERGHFRQWPKVEFLGPVLKHRNYGIRRWCCYCV